ncbi:MAG: DUF4129 domain-containing protein [Pyrinomonadaceae bacterium]
MTDLFRTAVCVAILLLVSAGQILAASLDDYQSRVDAAYGISRGLIDVAANEDADLEAEEVAELRRLLPGTESVDLPGGSVQVDNTWLAAAIGEFEAEQDPAKRTEMILGISERLAAIRESVRQLAAAAEAERTKDEDKQKLAEILRRSEYQKPEPQEESLFQRWWRELTDWLSRMFPRPAITPSTPSGFGSLKLGLQILIFAIVIGIVAFLLWKFVPLISGRFRGKKKRDDGDRVILGERLGSDVSADDIFSEAESLARLGDHRGAIRKGYIAVLCELGDRNIVRLARHKTNRDYLRDVRKREDLFTDMSGLTGNFERSWYGLRLAGAEDWEDFRATCRRAISSAKRS